jgi:hypothetical protein
LFLEKSLSSKRRESSEQIGFGMEYRAQKSFSRSVQGGFMKSRSFVYAAVAVIAAVLSFSGSARAATILQNGATVDGWMVSFPAGAGISLVADNSTGIVLDLEKQAIFSSQEGLVITFTQNGAAGTAAPQIAIVDESVTNATNQSWSGFQFLLTSPLAEGQTFASEFANTAITPFTTTTVDPTSTSVTLGGGTLAAGATGSWGFGANGGDLVMNANPSSSGMPSTFYLKEIPIVGGGTPVIPLPAAAWSSLVGLMGLSIIGGLKKLRRGRIA